VRPADFAITIDRFQLSSPPPAGADFTETIPLTVTNVSAGAADQLVIEIPAEPNGYWLLTAITGANGTLDTSDPSGARFVIIDPPAAGDILPLSVQLTYQWDSWSHDFVVRPDGSARQTARPGSSLTTTLAGLDDGDPTGHTATAPLPGYINFISPPYSASAPADP
jgi:hypothetical protein